MLFDPLVTVTPEGILPRLAKTWDVSADGKTLTLHLRDDVRFHNGKPFNADVAKAVLSAHRCPGQRREDSALSAAVDIHRCRCANARHPVAGAGA